MEIRAKCKLDYECVKALSYASMYRIMKPQTAFITTIIMGTLVLLLEILTGVFWGLDMISIGFLIFAVLLICLNCFLYFGIPRIQYNALDKMKMMENEYTFCDDVIKVSSKSEEYNAEGELKYSMIPKVKETSKYLFVFQTENQVFVVDKSTITNGTINDIREKLNPFVKKKYIICKY